jgi:NitT/TauT family transport system substrate-binding protein
MRKVVCAALSTVAIFLCSVSPLFAGGASEKADGNGASALRIGIMPDVDSVPLVMAETLGYYKDAGVDVELVSFKNPMNRDAALQAGEIDGAVSDLLAVAFAKKGGFRLAAVAKTDGDYVLLGSSALGIESIDALEGKSVALSRNTIIEYSTDRILAAEGKDSDFIEKVSIPQIPVRLEMLNSGKLAGATLPEPLASSAVASGATVLGSAEDLGINPGVLVFSSDARNKRADQIKAFWGAYNHAVTYLNGELSEAELDDIIKVMGFPESVGGVLHFPSYTFARLPAENEVREVVRWLLSHSLIDIEYRYEDLVDGSLLAP